MENVCHGECVRFVGGTVEFYLMEPVDVRGSSDWLFSQWKGRGIWEMLFGIFWRLDVSVFDLTWWF